MFSAYFVSYSRFIFAWQCFDSQGLNIRATSSYPLPNTDMQSHRLALLSQETRRWSFSAHALLRRPLLSPSRELFTSCVFPLMKPNYCPTECPFTMFQRRHTHTDFWTALLACKFTPKVSIRMQFSWQLSTHRPPWTVILWIRSSGPFLLNFT